MKARIERIYRKVFRPGLIDGTKSVQAFASVEVVRYEPINAANAPTIFVTTERFGFMQHGEYIGWRSLEEGQYSQYANIYPFDEHSAIEAAQARFASITNYLQSIIDEYQEERQVAK